MDDEIDHLKAFQASERVSLSKGHVLLVGLEQARAHQRGECPVKPARTRSHLIPTETRQAIRDAAGTHSEIAKLFNISPGTVQRLRAEPY